MFYLITFDPFPLLFNQELFYLKQSIRMHIIWQSRASKKKGRIHFVKFVSFWSLKCRVVVRKFVDEHKNSFAVSHNFFFKRHLVALFCFVPRLLFKDWVTFAREANLIFLSFSVLFAVYKIFYELNLPTRFRFSKFLEHDQFVVSLLTTRYHIN